MRLRKIGAVFFLLLLLPPHSAETTSPQSHLATIWPANVLRWEADVIDVATAFDLDPDLVAAVMWVESAGDPIAESYVGAVGLMGVMPLEKGFDGRPTAEQLLNPHVNLRWGSGILAQILKQAGGDLHAALAAYNGGWRLVDTVETRTYTAEVLHHYGRAIAAKANNPLLNVTRWTVAIDIQSGYGYTRPLLLGKATPFKVDLVGAQTVITSYENLLDPLRVVAHAVPIFEAPATFVRDRGLDYPALD